MNHDEYSRLKSEARDFIESTGKFKTPTNLKNHGEEYYGTGIIIYFDPSTEDDRIIAFIGPKGETEYLNLKELEEKLKM